MPDRHEIAVIGSGVIGAAVAWQCAERQRRTLILDRYAAPHDHGSSHGQTRLLRVAYAEGERYVPLVRRAISLWQQLGRRIGHPIFHQSGVVYVGQDDSPLISGVRAAAATHRVDLREIDESARPRVMPELQVANDWPMLIEDEGGYLYAEHAVHSMLSLAQASTYLDQRVAEVVALREEPDGIVLELQNGEVLRADRAVVCAGAWVGDLLPLVGARVQPQRQLLHWFDADPARFGEQTSFRPFGVNDARDGSFYYGFPRVDELGVKVGDHFAGEPLTHADDRRLDVADHEVEPTAQFVRRHLPQLGEHVQSRSCLYTCTASEDFLLDWAPHSDRVYVCSGFSGHGFKFAPAIGEAVAQTLLDQVPTMDISTFRM